MERPRAERGGALRKVQGPPLSLDTYTSPLLELTHVCRNKNSWQPFETSCNILTTRVARPSPTRLLLVPRIEISKAGSAGKRISRTDMPRHRASTRQLVSRSVEEYYHYILNVPDATTNCHMVVPRKLSSPNRSRVIRYVLEDQREMSVV